VGTNDLPATGRYGRRPNARHAMTAVITMAIAKMIHMESIALHSDQSDRRERDEADGCDHGALLSCDGQGGPIARQPS
jgi:hypothetical protein